MRQHRHTCWCIDENIQSCKSKSIKESIDRDQQLSSSTWIIVCFWMSVADAFESFFNSIRELCFLIAACTCTFPFWGKEMMGALLANVFHITSSLFPWQLICAKKPLWTWHWQKRLNKCRVGSWLPHSYISYASLLGFSQRKKWHLIFCLENPLSIFLTPSNFSVLHLRLTAFPKPWQPQSLWDYNDISVSKEICGLTYCFSFPGMNTNWLLKPRLSTPTSNIFE